jgi:Tfp pilus assembly protein PilF
LGTEIASESRSSGDQFFVDVFAILYKLLLAIYTNPLVTVLVVAVSACIGLGATVIGSYTLAEYHYQAAQRLLGRGDPSAAQSHITACLEARPDSADAHFLAARVARQSLNYREADRQLRECRRLGGVREMIELERLLARAQRGDLSKIDGRLVTMVERGHPDSLLILEALSRGYLQSFRLEEAFRSLKLWLEHKPDDVQALIWRGEVWERLLHPEDALADYRRAVELAPERAQERAHIVDTLISIRQPEEAVDHLAVLLAQEPENPKYLLNLARCRRLQGNTQEARRLIDQVLALTPDDATALAERGRLELEANLPGQAEPWLRKAVARAPYEKEIVYSLHQCLERTGQEAEARKYQRELEKIEAEIARLDKVLRKVSSTPGDPAPRHEAGMIFLRSGQAKEGIRWLNSALQVDPMYGPTHLELANYFDSAGDPVQAAWHRELAHQRVNYVRN